MGSRDQVATSSAAVCFLSAGDCSSVCRLLEGCDNVDRACGSAFRQDKSMLAGTQTFKAQKAARAKYRWALTFFTMQKSAFNRPEARQRSRVLMLHRRALKRCCPFSLSIQS